MEPDNDGVWYHQILDAHWGGVEEDDVSPRASQVHFLNDAWYQLGCGNVKVVRLQCIRSGYLATTRTAQEVNE